MTSPNINIQVDKVDEQDDIKASELRDPPKYVPTRMGSRVRIQKKIYKSMEVACKPIPDYISPVAQVLLKKLRACPYIIEFHGLSKIATERVMIFEWAELGTLRDVYQNNKIDWEAKISIARDICRGLVFLQSVKISHYDIRCENVLVNKDMQPKLCNFLSWTDLYNKFYDITPWLAPELFRYILTNHDYIKMVDSGIYTNQCEIFSFGMLLWELAFQEVPYKNMNMLEIQKYVSKGYRETLNSSLISKEYSEIIKLSWQHNPSLRPGIQALFCMLQSLYEKIVLKVESRVENQIKTINLIKPLKDGLIAHRYGNYKSSWDIFAAHADVGDILAMHWKGYYYLQGIYIVKNKPKAMKLFKKAADAGNSDAQLRYAFCFYDKENKNCIDINIFMKYLQLSADNNNITAFYNLGNVYFSGKLGIEKDKEKGIRYLRLAALYGNDKAIIEVFDVDN
ncbi:kinase-like protein [Rhizophagus irregularis]|uniref:Kinase-like protein n=1 Tax=Rhizophagus irregularis TaxID=588596 RepID=A0A2N0SKW0_9GLOM|nr:kinase-like protein [Rhizophagus irregularis]PKC76207.1 kinase-like protein [Rhizophagus irregularis]CAB4492588.1 unnamed protein product [Rhizophagus irregularis]CAB5195579.1 unnamed protein product [Rhizophagus irregularis]